MAVLSAANLAVVYGKVVENNKDNVTILKSDLQAAIAAADTWVDNNAASYNSALPVAARTNLTARQKALLIAWVILQRWSIL